jgi:hypothetical protein
VVCRRCLAISLTRSRPEHEQEETAQKPNHIEHLEEGTYRTPRRRKESRRPYLDAQNWGGKRCLHQSLLFSKRLTSVQYHRSPPKCSNAGNEISKQSIPAPIICKRSRRTFEIKRTASLEPPQKRIRRAGGSTFSTTSISKDAASKIPEKGSDRSGTGQRRAPDPRDTPSRAKKT